MSEGEKSAHPNTTDWLVLAMLVGIWGSTFAGISLAVKTISPGWVVAFRLAGASLALGLYLLLRRALNRPMRAHGSTLSLRGVKWFALIGTLATALPFLLYAHAAESTGSAVMAICNGGTPLGVAILAHVWMKERLTGARALGTGLGFLGLTLLVLPELTGGVTATFTGMVLAIIGAWLYSFGNVATRLAPSMDAAVSSFILVTAGALVAFPYAILFEPFPSQASPASIAAVIALALIPTGFAMFVYVWLIQRAGPMFVAFVTYLSPLWASALGVAVMGEEFNWSMAGALALILAGVWVANRPRKATS